MADRLRRLSWIRYFASGLLVVLVGSGAFYFLYVDKQGDRQSQYLLRLLGTAGQSVGETIVGLRGNVEKAATVSPAAVSSTAEKDGKRVPQNGPEQAIKKKDTDKLKDTIKKKLDLIPYLDTENTFKWLAEESRTEKLQDVSVGVSVKEDKGEYVLSFLVKHGLGAEIDDDKTSAGKDAFQVSAKLADLLAPSLPDDVFGGGVVVARRNETVLLQKGGGTVQLIQLPREKLSEDEERGTATDGPSTTEIRDVEIAGKKYKLFVQPFRLPLDIRWGLSTTKAESPLQGENNWLIGGLIPSAAFRADTMAVPFTFVAAVLFLLVVGFLCLPFLRIRFIGLREGLKAHDVFVLAVALMVASSLVAVAVIHILTYRAERASQEKELEQIADSINLALKCELDSLECELVRQARSLKVRFGRSPGDTIRARILASGRTVYPHFEMVFGMDASGMQKWKWSVQKTTTPVSPFPTREYFVRARDYDLDLRPSGVRNPCKEGSDFVNGRVVQSIRSKTTSEVFGMLSLRLVRGDTTKSVVSAIEAELLSLIDPVMPPGYGFAVIDGSGMVQFHSKRDRNLREDFFEEIDWNEDVTGSVSSGTEKNANITYRAEPRRAFVKPLDGTPWTLVVFADKRILGHLDLETIIFSLALYGLYLLVFLLSCALFHHICGRKTAPGEACRMWFWPDRDAEGRYRWMLAWVGLFLVLWCFGDVRLTSFMPIWCIVYPPILIAVLRWFLGRPMPDAVLEGKTVTLREQAPDAILESDAGVPRKQVRDAVLARHAGMSRKWQWTYVILVVALLFGVAVLPPFTFYKAVQREEVTVFTKQYQLALAQSLRDRIERHVDRFRYVSLSEANAKTIRRSLYLSDNGNRDVRNSPDVHVVSSRIVEFGGKLTRPDPAAVSRQRIMAFLSRLPVLPTYDETSSVTRGLSDPGPPGEYDMAWFIESDSGRACLARPRPAQGDSGQAGLGPVRPAGSDSAEAALDAPRPARNDSERVALGPTRAPRSDSAPTCLSMTIPNFQRSIVLGSGPAIVDSLSCNHLLIQTPLRYLRPANSTGVFLAAVGAILALLWIVRTIMRVVFLNDMPYPLAVRGEDLLNDPTLDRQLRIRLRGDKPRETQGESPHIIDIRDIETAESAEDILDSVASSSKPEVVLTKFDYGLGDPEIAAKKLDLLEGLAAMEETRIIIESSVDPLYFLTSAAHDAWKAEGGEQIPLDRWAAVLQKFQKLRRKATEDEFGELRASFKKDLEEVKGFGDLRDDVQESLVSEGWPNRYLKSYAKALALRSELRGYTAGDVVDQVQDLAAAHYRRIWSACSTNERVLLYRLAQEGFVNWRMKDTLRSLIRRRLVVAAPNFRLMNESFRRFVLRAERPEVFQNWEKHVGPSLWSKVRLPLILSGVVLAAFFIATQRDVFNQSLGMLAALTAGAPALIKIIGALTQSRDSSSTQG